MTPVDTLGGPESPQRRDADFEQVRTRLKTNHSGIKGDPVGKYFHEATVRSNLMKVFIRDAYSPRPQFDAHYDGRFADRVLPEDQRDHALISLVRTYLSKMSEIRAETWLMHGSLLGWWWNRKIMPWDNDIDVQMSMESMNYLAAYHNMTIHEFTLPPETKRPRGSKDDLKINETAPGILRSYLLEINPNYVNGTTDDKWNRIDARWIDTDTGLYIDITTLRPDVEAAAQGKVGKMMCKDGHRYLMQDIFPLRISDFEGVPAKIPYAYSELLEEEYGRASLTKTSFQGHMFDQKLKLWIPLL